MCQKPLGTQMPGTIVRVKVDPFGYIVEDVGEEIQFGHGYQYYT